MKRLAVIAALAAAAGAPSAFAALPHIVIARSSPLVVMGSHFRAHERVTVTIGRNTRSVRATALGSFRASFAAVAFDRCSASSITAVGTLGDRAALVFSHTGCPAA